MDFEITKHSFLILFGSHVKKLRKEQKLSLRQLAARCNIDASDIFVIEKGMRNITLSTMLELSKGLEVQPKELFDLDFNLENNR